MATKTVNEISCDIPYCGQSQTFENGSEPSPRNIFPVTVVSVDFKWQGDMCCEHLNDLKKVLEG